MALGPDGLITVTGDIDTITDGAASGRLTVSPSGKLQINGKTYAPLDREVELSADGTFSISLPPTVPGDVTYRFSLIVYSYVGTERQHYEESFNAALDPAQADAQGVVQYRDLAPVAAPGVPQTFLTRTAADLRYFLLSDAAGLVTDADLAQALLNVEGGGGGGTVDLSAYATTQALSQGLSTRVPEADFTERVQDAVAALLAAGTGVTVSYDDATGRLTLTASAGGGGSTDPEAVRDTIGAALTGVGLVSVVANDAGDTITITTTATQNATDAQLRDRGTHTGTQAISTITSLQAALDLKAATADLAAKVNESDFIERVQDAVAALLAAGTGVTVTYDDALGRLTLASSATGGATDPEVVRDTIGVALVGAGLISVAVNDAGDTLTITTSATANSTDAQLRDRTTHTGSQAISTVTGLQTALDTKVVLGTTSTTAKAGDYQPTAANISDATAVGRSVLTATDTTAARGVLGVAPLASLLLWAAKSPDSMAVGTITYNASGAPTGHNVAWPSGATGVYAGTASTTFPDSIDSYAVTHVLAGTTTTTYTQPAVTRDGNGQVTNRPAVTVA